MAKRQRAVKPIVAKGAIKGPTGRERRPHNKKMPRPLLGIIK